MPANKTWFVVAVVGTALAALSFVAALSFLATLSFLTTGSFLAGSRLFDEAPPLPEQSGAQPLAPDLEQLSLDALARIAPSATTESADTAPGEEAASSRSIDPRTLRSSQRTLDADCAEPITVTAPATDFAATVAAAEVATCFLLQAGEYRFHDVEPKDHMTFLGVGRDQVRVVGSPQTENAFHGTSTGVNIGRMTLTGFQGTGGHKPQEQAAIRGTSAIWMSDRGQMASDWLIEDVEVSNGYAAGIFLGDHFTVRASTIRDNAVTGLGGSEIVGGLVEGNIVSGNGEGQLDGYEANGGGMKFTEAGSPGDPLVIHRNEIFANSGIGVWCDIACNGFEVIGNYIHDQVSRAVMFELSRNAVVKANLIVNANTWSNFAGDFNAGAITVGESSDVTIEDNYIDGAVAGVVVRQTRRPVLPQESFLYDYEGVVWVSERIHVRNNVIANTEAMGISTGATGEGLIPDAGTIRFEANAYTDPGSMAFWWDTGNRYSFDEWQASGRDVGGPGTVPGRPEWTALSP